MIWRLIVFVGVTVALLSATDRKWLSGKILDSAAAEAYLGSVHPVSHGRSYDVTPRNGLETQGRSWIKIPSYGIRETYVIEAADGQRFAGTRVLQTEKPSRIAEMREVRFVVEKKSLIVMDDKGRQHKFKLVNPDKTEGR